MSLKNIHTSDLIIELVRPLGTYAGVTSSDIAAELDRRLPVPGECEDVKVSVSAGTIAILCGDCGHALDFHVKGGCISDGCDCAEYSYPATPAAPTDGYVELGSLKPGDVFEDQYGAIGVRHRKIDDYGYADPIASGGNTEHGHRVTWGERAGDERVRKLRILRPGERVLGADEIAVRDGQALLERLCDVIAKECGTVTETAHAVIAALKSAGGAK